MFCTKGKVILFTGVVILLMGAAAATVVKIFFFNPPNLKITVTNASLPQFKLSKNSDTLFYTIAFDLTSRNLNHNRHVANKDVLYSRIEAIAKFRSQNFAKWTLSLPPFIQHRKNTTFLQYPAIHGQQRVRFSKNELSQFNREIAVGIYSIQVVVSMLVKGNTKRSYNCEWQCMLKIPMSSNQAPFQATKCSRIKYKRA